MLRHSSCGRPGPPAVRLGVGNRGPAGFAPYRTGDPQLAHEPGHPVSAHLEAFPDGLTPQLASAVHLIVLIPDPLQLGFQLLIRKPSEPMGVESCCRSTWKGRTATFRRSARPRTRLYGLRCNRPSTLWAVELRAEESRRRLQDGRNQPVGALEPVSCVASDHRRSTNAGRSRSSVSRAEVRRF